MGNFWRWLYITRARRFHCASSVTGRSPSTARLSPGAYTERWNTAALLQIFTVAGLIFAESDGLPAVVADAFGDVIVMQVLCLGMEAFKRDIVDALVTELSPRGIFERNDVPVRTLEGLPMQTGLLYGEVPDRVEMVENGVRFWVDVKEGQKTGFFLDQKENRAAIAPFAKGARVLDCFTHTGSFALHAARYGAIDVTGVDISDFRLQFCRRKRAGQRL